MELESITKCSHVDRTERKQKGRGLTAIKTDATIKAEEVGEWKPKCDSVFLYFANGCCQDRFAKPVMKTNTVMSWPDLDGRCSGWQPTPGSREKKMCNLYTKFFLTVTRVSECPMCCLCRGVPLGSSVREMSLTSGRTTDAQLAPLRQHCLHGQCHRVPGS